MKYYSVIKSFFATSILMSSFFANSTVLNIEPGASIRTALDLGVCSITIANRPVIFGKDSRAVKVGQLLVIAKTRDSEQVRRLPVGRALKIHNLQIYGEHLRMKDPSVDSIYLNATSMLDLTLEDFTQLSDGNLSIKCIDDAPVNF